LAGEAAEIAENVGGKLRLAARLGPQSIAGFKCDRTRNVLGRSLHLVSDAEEEPAAVGRCDLAPCLECACCGFDCPATSAASPRGIVAIDVRLAGFSTVSVAPERLSTHEPSISICSWRKSAFACGRMFSITVMRALSLSICAEGYGVDPP